MITIKYATGGQKDLAADIDLIREDLAVEFGPDYVHYNGLIWESDAESIDDDGRNAVAELISESGQRLTDFPPVTRRRLKSKSPLPFGPGNGAQPEPKDKQKMTTTNTQEAEYHYHYQHADGRTIIVCASSEDEALERLAQIVADDFGDTEIDEWTDA